MGSTFQFLGNKAQAIDVPAINQTCFNLRFLKGQLAIPAYRATIFDILQWDSQQLQISHAYIQWLFPTKRKSAFNVHSFPLTEDQIGLIKHDREARQNYLKGLKLMGQFFGFKYNEKGMEGNADIKTRFEHCFIRCTHNRLRMSRILQSLYQLGYQQIMKMLSQFLYQQFKALQMWDHMESTYASYYQAGQVIKQSNKL